MNANSPGELPNRSRPVHQPVIEAGNRATIVFLTVCTKDKRSVLATPDMHQLLLTVWTGAKHWLVGRYVIMPDHIHLFCAPGSDPPESLESWVIYWKHQMALSIGGGLWQKNFWDTQLRRHESYSARWDYVRNNPVRAGLSAISEVWPYQGELNVLRWHD